MCTHLSAQLRRNPSCLSTSASGNALFVIESGKTRTRAAIEALNRLETTGTHILGATLTKSEESSSGYGRYGYGYGYGYGAKGRLAKTEILMIPQAEEEGADNPPVETEA